MTAEQPAPRRRRLVWLGVTAAVAAVGGAVVAVALTGGSGPTAEPLAYQPLAYHALPGTCRLLSASTLSRYLPGAIVSPETEPAPPGNPQLTADCSWDSISGQHDRMLGVTVAIYGGRNGVSDAHEAFAGGDNYLAAAAGGPGTRAVTGVGDEATADTSYAGADTQETTLAVRSSNAVAAISYSDTAITQSPDSHQLATLADDVAIARDVLAVLAHPGTAAAVTISSSTGPSYTAPPHACRLISSATLNKYLPGATADTSSPDTPTGGISGCDWNTQSSSSLAVEITVDDSELGPGGAQVSYELLEQTLLATGGKISGTQPVTGVGNQAIALYPVDGQTRRDADPVWQRRRSGHVPGVVPCHSARRRDCVDPRHPDRTAQGAVGLAKLPAAFS